MVGIVNAEVATYLLPLALQWASGSNEGLHGVDGLQRLSGGPLVLFL